MLIFRILLIKQKIPLYFQMRLKATMLGLWLLPPSILGFAWVSEQHVHVSAICVMLFLCGFFSMSVPVSSRNVALIIQKLIDTLYNWVRWMYASTIAYVIDANNGRASSAVAANSSFRGLYAFISTEIAVPLQVRS
jgi:hypothetical protein